MPSVVEDPPRIDPRAARSRAAIHAAALELISTRGTTDIPVREIAKAAGVSRNVIYTHYGDRAGLVSGVALDLIRDAVRGLTTFTDSRDSERFLLHVASHMAEHRQFYRAALSGPDGRAFAREFDTYFLGVGGPAVEGAFPDATEEESKDLNAFLLTATGAHFATWVLTGPDRLDPAEFAQRLTRIFYHLLPALHTDKDR